jgi:purine-binding chemotaxis protein CheW
MAARPQEHILMGAIMAITAQKPLVAEGKHLTFKLGGEEYGLDIMKVREIVGLMAITSVPQTSMHIRGVMNLRGKIIPVMDLRRKFGLPDIELTKENCIITCMVKGANGGILVGVLVDSVSEVIQLVGEDVDPMPDLADMRVDFVPGVVKSRGRVIILLDIDRVVQGHELDMLESLVK